MLAGGLAPLAGVRNADAYGPERMPGWARLSLLSLP